MNLIQQITAGLSCSALCTMLHYAWVNRKHILNELKAETK